jgi:CubicO group peptidase (beta-lactamase class C family)
VAVDWVPAFEVSAEQTLRLYQAPGMSLAVAREGRMVYHRGFGFRDRERRLPVTPDTIYGIGSITKSFTCVALLQLQERGRLSVDDPVQRHIPEFTTPDRAAAAAMTLHHFMTHTSGLPPLPSLYPAMARSMAGDPATPAQLAGEQQRPLDTYADLLAALAAGDYELLGPPGAHFSYSNDAYALLGLVVERASGQPYPEYVRQHILEPAGLTATGFLPPPPGTDAATLYALRPECEEVYPAPVWWDAPAMLAAGFLKSNATDLLRYLELYRTGGLVGGERLLGAASVAAMMRPYAAMNPYLGYGYGLMVTPGYHGLTLVEHSGGLKGISAHVTVVPERGITAVALCNLGGVPSGSVLLRAVNGLLGLPLLSRRAEYPAADWPPPEQLAAYAGEYRSGEGAHVRVEAVGDRLAVTSEGRRLAVRPAGEDAFVLTLKEDEIYARFLRRQGRVWAVAFGSRIVRRA